MLEQRFEPRSKLVSSVCITITDHKLHTELAFFSESPTLSFFLTVVSNVHYVTTGDQVLISYV